MPPSSDAAPARRPSLLPVLLVEFIGTLGFSIVMPFLVFLIVRLGGNAVIYGLVGATYPLFQFVGAPVMGRWSDRFGRKRVLLVSQAGTLLSWIVFAVALLLPVTELVHVDNALLGEFSLTLPLLVVLIARGLDGLTGGNISVANAYVADISDDATRNRNFGRMGIAANLGFIGGPALAGVLGGTALGEVLPVLAALAISLVATVLIAVALPESTPCGVPAPASTERATGTFGRELRDCQRAAEAEPHALREALRQPGVRTILLLNFVLLLSFNLFYTAFPARVAQHLHWSVTDTGVFFAVLSALLVLVEGPVLSTLSRRFREDGLIVVGCLLLGVNFLLLLSPRVEWIYGAALLFALGNGIMWPSLVSVVARVAGPERQGAVQGLSGSADSLASIVGLVAGGIVFGLAGTGTFVLAALFAFASAGIALLLHRLLRGSAAAA